MVYRPKTAADNESKYTSCPSCLGWFAKGELWKHRANSKLNIDGSHRHKAASKALLPLPITVSNTVQEVIARMKFAEVTLPAKNDRTIMKVGERLLMKHGHDLNTNSAYIRTTLRDLAKILLAYRKLNPAQQTLRDMIDPRNFEKIVKVVRDLRGFNQSKYS